MDGEPPRDGAGYVSRDWTRQVDATLGELCSRLEAVLVLLGEQGTELAGPRRRVEALEGALALADARLAALEAGRRRPRRPRAPGAEAGR